METTPTPDFKKDVLSRIEREGVCPRARWLFVGRECAVWGAWLFTVAVAAVAVAVSLFVIMHQQYAFYEATHDSFLALMLEVLPYLWFVVFVVGLLLALYHLRHTRRGYRYSLFGTALAGAVASLAGGAVLHYVGMGFVFDKSFGHYVPGYWSQEMMEEHFWQQPEKGRILGTYVGEGESAGTVLVKDVAGKEWQVSVSELFAPDLALLSTGKQVRLLGRTADGAEGQNFYACGVFPWLYDRMMTMKELHNQREEAVARLHQHRDRLLAEMKAIAPAPGDEKLPPPASHCGEIEAVKRLRN